MKISIIGAAGCIGSSTAFNIALQGLADEVVMIDIPQQQNPLLHHVIDLSDAVAAQDIAVRAGSFEDMPGSDIVINAAGVHQKLIVSRLDMLPKNLPIIRDIAQKINQFCPEAVVITSTNPVCPLNYATYLLSPNRERSRFIGFSLNDSVRFRRMVAQALGVRTSQVEGTVIGEHGDSQVLLFSSVRVKGRPVSISGEVKEKIRQQIPNVVKKFQELNAGRTAGWTSGVGMAAITRAIVEDSGATIPCSAVLDGEYGGHRLSMGVPAVIGRGGIQEVLEFPLDADEREELAHSIAVLQPAMSQVEEYVGAREH